MSDQPNTPADPQDAAPKAKKSAAPRPQPEPSPDASPIDQAATEAPEGPEKVQVKLGDGDPIEVQKPSAEYTQYVYGYGYEEV